MSTDDDKARVANIFDVARLAGVSHQTVSRVLNDLPNVRPATRLRVEQAIKQLRYVPSPAARALVTRRSRTLGLITAGRPDYGPSSAALNFNEAAREARYAVSMASMIESDAVLLRAAVEMLLRQNVEAIVLIAAERRAIEAVEALELGVPLVAVASEGGGAAGSAGSVPAASFVAGAASGAASTSHRVAIDQYGGARTAVEHLIALGHREIRHLGGPIDSMDAAERLRGWRDVLSENNLVAREPLVGDWQPSSGNALGASLATDAEATAVFAANDQMALGLIHALERAGRRVPADMSVIGFDDIPEAAFFAPPLSTMRQDFDGLGRDIMATVLDVLRDEQAPDPTRRAPELVLRASTAPPRSAR
ncbi:LacI family DNA-binding transcriptional regulator [Leifsonia sp. YIM 134122]|uniref:LacI family DNA-binding transcriptional regulator n=1 Tax=Leifsonia stereocauli TaxID=3134136 RepID=A0ABU9W5Z2_9MICO